jgi:hypothetical protein
VPSAELETVLSDAGGADAPRAYAAQLRRLLARELARGLAELELPRSGYPDPVVVGLAPSDDAVLAALPVAPALRADPGAVSERAAALTAVAVEKLVEATAAEPPSRADDLTLTLGEAEDALVVRFPAAEPREAAEYAREALAELFDGMDRLRCRVLVLPAHALEGAGDFREPIGPTHPLRVAEAVARLGGSPLDDDSVEALEPVLLELLEPPGAVARAHDDPDPRRRTARRILQRLDGRGKWGGYHTEFEHLARGFPRGNERAVAKEIGERLLAAGLLGEKQSVGQRHVFLDPRRSGDIRRLIDDGQLPAGLSLG